MSYHNLGPVSGSVFGACGWIGVDDFFVISGFLITTLILKESKEIGTISTKRFYLRRFFRLYPALVVFICICYFWLIKDGYFFVLGSIIIAFAGLTDMDLALKWGISQVAHLYMTWSLSVEEKFYIIYPQIANLAKKQLASAICMLLLLVELWKLYIIVVLNPTGYERLAYGFDVKCDMILIGCLLGVLVSEPSKSRFSALLKKPLFCTLLLTAVSLSTLTIDHPMVPKSPIERISFWSFRMPLHALLFAGLIASLLQNEHHPLRKFLSLAPLVWIGKISYSLYLWHLFAFGQVDDVFVPMLQMRKSDLIFEPIRFWLAISVAASSFYLIESPIRTKFYKSMKLRSCEHPSKTNKV